MDNIKNLHQTFIKQARARSNELNAELSHYDSQLQDALHFLENENYDAVAMVKTAKLIKQIRQDRRKVKVEKDQINSLLSVMCKKDLDKFERKTYTYRTDVMKIISTKQNDLEE